MTVARAQAAEASALPVDHRRVLSLALPMVVAHATTPLMGLVSTAAIGRLGDPSLLGAVALGAVIFDFLFWTFGSLRMATAGLTAQAIGAGDGGEVDALASRALLVAAAIGGLIVVLQVPLGAISVRLAGGSEAVTGALDTYFYIRVWASPFTLGNYAVLGSVLGRGRTGVGLALQMVINLVNIGLTVLFVSYGGQGVGGAALASVIAEVAGLAAGLVVLTYLGANPFRAQRQHVFKRDALLRMLAVNRDVIIRTVALTAVYGSFAAAGARDGDVTLAANSVLQNLWLTAGYVLDGFATATETLCGQSLGAGSAERFRRAVRLALTWCFGFGLVLSGLFLVGGGTFIDAVTTSPAVRAEARRFLLFAAATPIVSAAAFTFDGVFVGATWTQAMRNLMVVAFALFLLVQWLLTPWGNAGLWTAMLAFLAARGALQAFAYPGLLRKTFSETA